MSVHISASKLDSIFASETKKPSATVEIVSLPPTPPPETRDEELWTDKTHATQDGNVNQTESDSIVAVIGVGYVGEHLVRAFAGSYKVIAFDLSEKRLQLVSSQLQGLPIQFTTSAADISQATHALISVPTILNEDKSVDTTYLRSAISTVEKHMKPGSTVVIESSVAVGMTRQLVGPLMGSKYFKVGMSPEVCKFECSVLNQLIVMLTSCSELTLAEHYLRSKRSQKSFLAWMLLLSNLSPSSMAAYSVICSLYLPPKLPR